MSSSPGGNSFSRNSLRDSAFVNLKTLRYWLPRKNVLSEDFKESLMNVIKRLFSLLLSLVTSNLLSNT